MVYETLLMLAVLTLPLLAGVFLVWFMATGKGNPAPTQDEIEEFKRNREGHKASQQ
ncbi:hypothetical protein [Schleiferia thermophila]|jgi:hypothetical protein|nr:hypothetical protein [Schleiferia thermophila]KFD38850.1 hypothetical protein AT05_08090 [Schleiferia thermophila str. Yellowstone]GCD79731.1 hypothetical protein JCM30197_09780 [Schleiferia thermophila]